MPPRFVRRPVRRNIEHGGLTTSVLSLERRPCQFGICGVVVGVGGKLIDQFAEIAKELSVPCFGGQVGVLLLLKGEPV
jgi:hypothetical protein